MKGILIVAVLVAAGYFGWQKFGGGYAKVIERGGAKVLVASLDGGEAEFQLGTEGEETYMVFGAGAGGDFSSDGWIAGIPVKVAARLKQRYPDFTRCDSAGAKEAESRIEDIKVVAGKSAHRSALKKIASEFTSRIEANGERLCVTVRGTWLALLSSEKGGERLTYEQMKKIFPAQALQGAHVLPSGFELRDCKELI